MSVLKVALVVLVTLGAAFGLWYLLTPPPNQLSQIDALVGGGAGTEQPGNGIAFGTHAQTLDVWRPEGTEAGAKLPVIVFFYGGGWHAGSRQGYAFAGRGFASRGYVTVIPDYRKYPDVRFPDFIEDGAQAMKWVRDHVADYGGDPDKVVIAGHSAGAHIAAMLGLDRHYLAQHGVDPAIVKGVIGLSGPYDFLPLDNGNAQHSLGNWPRPAETQPITFAHVDAPPMLLVTSEKDITVKPRNTFALTRRLNELGVPVEMRDYPGINHEEVAMALSTPFRGKAPVLQDADAFAKGVLK